MSRKEEIPRFGSWLNEVLNRDILPLSVLLNIWWSHWQKLGEKCFQSDPYADGWSCPLSLVLTQRLSFREILTESRPRRDKYMQVSCNKAINTTVFPWFFFLLRSSSELERHKHSKLRVAYLQDGLSARRGAAADCRDFATCTKSWPRKASQGHAMVPGMW